MAAHAEGYTPSPSPLSHSRTAVDTDSDSDSDLEDALAGVSRVEAAAAVWGPRSRWILFLGIALAAYVYSLDGERCVEERADRRHDDVPVSQLCVSPGAFVIPPHFAHLHGTPSL